MPGRAVRSAVLGAVLFAGTALAAVLAVSPPVAAAVGCSYSISGNVSPRTAQVGDPMTATATLTTVGHNCGSTSVSIWGVSGVFGDHLLGTCPLPGSGGTCVAKFAAYAGLTSVEARTPGSPSASLGNVTVTSPPPPKTTTVAPPPSTVVVRPTTSAAQTSASATATKTKAKPKPTVTRTNPALKMPDSPWETGSLPSEAPLATDSADATVGGIPLSAEVTHGSGGVGVPMGLVLASVVVIAGLFGAVVRLVVGHTRSEAGR